MISNIDYMKLAMSYENDKTEIDPVLRSRVWGVVLVGLAMFWSIIALIICNIWIVN
ncbi:YmiA family putative membrane protein [Klebsiella pneumoniae]|nr:YmiA family putative membrane protein [Klebsiella pneumoniae]